MRMTMDRSLSGRGETGVALFISNGKLHPDAPLAVVGRA